MEFSELDLRPELVRAVTELGYETPTPIQESVIPVLLAGHDVIGQAQTGTGKTAAFALPSLNQIVPRSGHVQCLVLAPTRELAMQVAEAMAEFGRYLGINVLPIYGGQPYGGQISRLRRGVDVVVGTPGRIIDLIERSALNLSHVQTVILDEADEMLSMGFVDAIESILKVTPETRQTALFSATLPAPIRQLANRYMRNPQAVTVKQQKMTVSAIEQRYYLVNEKDKLSVLTRLFELEPIQRTLIFARTRAQTSELANELSRRGWPAEALNGDLSQDARERVLSRFRQDHIKVLVATDVAARGLDIDDVTHVFNFDLPNDPEVYVHRIGRTGRAGKTGIAATLLTPSEHRHLRRLEQFTKQPLVRVALPTEEEIHAYRENQLLEKLSVWLRRGRCRREYDIVTKMVAEGQDPLELAAVALKLARAEEKQRPVDPIAVVQEETRSSDSRNGRMSRNGSGDRQRERVGGSSNRDRDRFGGGNREREQSPSGGLRASSRKDGDNHVQELGMVRLQIDMGKQHGVRPKDIVGTIAYHADIPGSAIGAIRIQEQYTLIDVPQQLVEKVLSNNGRYRIHQQPMILQTI